MQTFAQYIKTLEERIRTLERIHDKHERKMNQLMILLKVMMEKSQGCKYNTWETIWNAVNKFLEERTIEEDRKDEIDLVSQLIKKHSKVT